MAVGYSNTLLFSSSDTVVSGPCTTTKVCSTSQSATGDGNETIVFSASGTTSQNVDITSTGIAGYTSVVLNVKSGSVTLDHGANYFRAFGVQTVFGPGFIAVGGSASTPVTGSQGTIRMTVSAGTEWEIIAVGEA